jgi:hypothetical protein
MKMNLYTSSLIAVCMLLSSSLLSQRGPEPLWSKSPNGNYRCFTDEADIWRKQQNATTNKASLESWINNSLKKMENEPMLNRNIPIIYNIPVIFHIVHSGEAEGTGTNIGAAYINAQIQQLNNDFRKIAGTSGYNNHPLGADVQIQFAAATLDTNNNTLAQAGIQRINKTTFGATFPPFNINYIEATIKPNSTWNATKYLNIWVMDLNGLLGYAQFPDAPNEPGNPASTAANTDGVVVHYSSVGSSVNKFPGSYPYDEGRTLTHEVGHWLGLRHIWGDGNCTTDDFVFDTPRASGPHFGCVAATTNSCNDITYGAPADSNDMVRNYMDYSDDRCMDIFTTGQMNRMRVVMGVSGAGAPRRAVLRLSDRSSAAPIVTLLLTDTTVFEKTNCLINWAYTIPVRMSRVPNATTTVTLTQTSGNTDGQDYSINPTSVEFSASDMTDKYFTVMVNADAVSEGHEMAYFNLGVSGSNATAATDSFELIIWNDDWPPFNGKRIPATILSDDFEGAATGWISNDYVVGNNKWLVGGTNGNMNGNKSAYISKNNSALEYDATSTSHSILYKQIDAWDYDSLALSFYYVCKGEKDANGIYDYGKVVYSTDSITFHQLNGTTDLADSNNMTNLSVQLPYFLWNRKFYIGFYWENDNVVGNDPSFAIDDITITGRRWMPSMIHTAVDSSSGYDEKPVGPMQTVNFYDKTTGDVLATIQDLGGYNWGCVKVEVDRAGTGAQWVTGDPQTQTQSKLFDKTYKVTPTNNNANGQYKVTFYLTQNEVTGWALASNNPIPQAKIIKYSGRINDMTYTSNYEQKIATTHNAFLGGVDYEFSAQFNTGFSGFGFGFIPPSTLPVHIITFNAKQNNQTVDLLWKTENEDNLDYYKVMRSHDGINYEAIGNVLARGSAGNTTDYNLTDPKPFIGKNFYQLALYDRNGTFKKSQVVQVDIRTGIMYTVSPNPFIDQLIIGQPNSLQQSMLIQLTDLQGRTVMTKQFNNQNGQVMIHLDNVSSGIYLLKITNEDGSHVFKVVKE